MDCSAALVELPGSSTGEGHKNATVSASQPARHAEVAASHEARAVTLRGTRVYQIGIPTLGFGVSAEQNPELSKHWLANALTPMVGDVGARTPEFKAFLVNIEKL